MKKIKLRCRKSPLYWRKVAETENPVRIYNWQLVLASQNITFIVRRSGYRKQIYVPPLLEMLAVTQLSAFDTENVTQIKTRHLQHIFPNAWLAIVPLVLLILWHAFRSGFLHCPAWLPSPEEWLSLGALDNIRIELYSEYYRVITALTLHSNASHLAGNLFFGSLFLYLLARRIGYGTAFLLACLGGVGGNCLSLLFHQGSWLSIGFSTAVFAAAGGLSGYMASNAESRRAFFLACGSGLALLAMLGTGEENTDYAAHCCGLLCGVLAGFAEGLRQRIKIRCLPDALSLLLAFLIYFAGWGFAFQKA